MGALAIIIQYQRYLESGKFSVHWDFLLEDHNLNQFCHLGQHIKCADMDDFKAPAVHSNFPLFVFNRPCAHTNTYIINLFIYSVSNPFRQNLQNTFTAKPEELGS